MCFFFPLLPAYLAAGQGESSCWSPSLYPDLYTPSSPAWSLIWTYRDSQLVNLPVSLLVEGDVVALRPGQEAFASLRGLKVGVLLVYPALVNSCGGGQLVFCPGGAAAL